MEENEDLNIQGALEKYYEPEPDGEVEAEPTETADVQEGPSVPQQQESVPEPALPAQEEKPLLVPPADMNAAERDAYLNPTPQNQHILQNYLNRRAYENRADYQRKTEEVARMKREIGTFYDVFQENNEYYARAGVPIQEVAKRAIAWDKGMAKDPVGTAMDYLAAYKISPYDLIGLRETQAQAPQQTLTKADAERIAEEKLQNYLQQQQQKSIEHFNTQAVNSFMSSKPLFRDPETASQLENEMAPVVKALTDTGRYNSPQEILETAYNYVVNGNPVFSSIVNKIAAKPVIDQQNAAAQKAKQAAKSISGSSGSGTPSLQIKDLRENLRRRLATNE
jgi:hypothetical protein